MLPCKKRRTTLTESPQHQGNQEEDDLDLQAAGKPESDLGSVKDLGSVSLSWSPSHGRAADLEVQAAGIQLGMEDPSLSSRMLTEDTNVAVLEAVDVAISQEITLASLESSQPVNTHIGKGKLQATSSRRGKKITLRPGSVTQEDRGDHPIAKEPFSEEPSEEVKAEGEEANDDHPECNFLEELDEPDAKDFCTDQAVRITKKDMNELMEESFETKEPGTFAQNSIALHHQFSPKFQTLFQPCNLMGAMKLIEAFSTQVSVDWSPRKTLTKTAYRLPYLLKQVAWILATSKVFMYPELLPVCSLKPMNPQDKNFFTKAEDSSLALGLKHFEGTEFPKPLISKYLLACKTAHQLTVRIKNLNMNRAPDNIIKVLPACSAGHLG